VRALLPSVLGDGELAAANAGLGIARDGAMALGAAGAGLALAWTGAAAALAADLVTFVLAAALFARLGPETRRPKSAARERPADGIRSLLRRRAVLTLVLSFGAATVATGLTNASLPRFLDGLGLGPGGYGFGIAALAGGLALGQGAVGFTRPGPGAGNWIGAALIVMAGLFVLLGFTVHAPTALLLIAAIGFVDGTTDVLFETTVQRQVDPRHYGAVFGASSAFIMTTMMSAIAFAPIANRLFAPSGVILGASLFLIVAGAIALLADGPHGHSAHPGRAPARKPLQRRPEPDPEPVALLWRHRTVVPEAELEQTEAGFVPTSIGWFELAATR